MAMSASKPASKSITMLAPPRKAVERISLMPSMLRSCSSSGLMMSRSESSGEMPS
jgi:hypothetical protein